MLNTNLHKFYFVMRPNRAGLLLGGLTFGSVLPAKGRQPLF